MGVRVIIPVRPLDEGKTRLAPALSPAERIALNQQFFRHVLDICRAVVPASQCLVVSRSANVLDEARAAGVRPVMEAGDGLNAALEQAARAAAAEGQNPILTISTDLPLLSRGDLDALIKMGERVEMVIAPDRTETGTNALLLRRPGLIPYCYGSRSFEAHCAAARKHELSVEVIERPGLACDVDTPTDLQKLVQIDNLPGTSSREAENDTHEDTMFVPDWRRIRPDLTGRQ